MLMIHPELLQQLTRLSKVPALHEVYEPIKKVQLCITFIYLYMYNNHNNL